MCQVRCAEPHLPPARCRPLARAGKLAEMGFGYEACRELNSKLVYASVSGASCSLSDRLARSAH